jgi:hypothetical protein
MSQTYVMLSQLMYLQHGETTGWVKMGYLKDLIDSLSLI